MDQNKIEKILKKSIRDLEINDSDLISIDEDSIVIEYIPEKIKYERKLHEVCINHRLAVYLDRHLREEAGNHYCVDIEYNRYYKNQKAVKTADFDSNVRPDIIVHKRMDRTAPQHLLVIEAKKDRVDQYDEKKIRALMKDERYQYLYGARIVYKDCKKIKIDFYYKIKDEIKNKKLFV